MVSYIAPKKPKITPTQRRVRLQWCYEHLSWSEKDWSNVIFSDESNYEILNRKNRIYIRRFRNHPSRFQRSQQRVHKGGGIVFVSYILMYQTDIWFRQKDLFWKYNIHFSANDIGGSIILIHPVHEHIRCTRKRRNGKTRILASFLLESPLLKEIAGDLDIPLSKNFIIYTVFHALSNDVIFINSAGNKKFATCSYIRNFQLRTELTKITSPERAQNTEQEYQIFSKRCAQVLSKNFLK